MWSVFAQFLSELVLVVNDLWREEKGRKGAGGAGVEQLTFAPVCCVCVSFPITEDFSLLFSTTWRKSAAPQNIPSCWTSHWFLKRQGKRWRLDVTKELTVKKTLE